MSDLGKMDTVDRKVLCLESMLGRRLISKAALCAFLGIFKESWTLRLSCSILGPIGTRTLVWRHKRK